MTISNCPSTASVFGKDGALVSLLAQEGVARPFG